ncbi:12258_t:CDS:2, partial [Acaulospora colombiana]
KNSTTGLSKLCILPEDEEAVLILFLQEGEVRAKDSPHIPPPVRSEEAGRVRELAHLTRDVQNLHVDLRHIYLYILPEDVRGLQEAFDLTHRRDDAQDLHEVLLHIHLEGVQDLHESRSSSVHGREEKERDLEESARRFTSQDSSPSKAKEEKAQDIVKPNFGLSGKLASESNKFNGVALKYQEPPEARKPTKRWRLYVFKNEEQLGMTGFTSHFSNLEIVFIFTDKVADIPIDHPSCSSQHAVLQFRQVTFTDPETGEQITDVKPYLIDLESTNSTFVNKKAIPTSRYVELRAYDEIKFGFSTRDYVLLHEELAD